MNHIRKFVEYDEHGRQRVETAQKTYDLPATVEFNTKQIFPVAHSVTALALVNWKKNGNSSSGGNKDNSDSWEVWAGDERGAVIVWEIDTHHGRFKPRNAPFLKKMPRHPTAEPIVALTQVGDKSVWTATKSTGIFAWNTQNMQVLGKMPCDGTTCMVSWKYGDHEYIFSTGDEGVIRIWSPTKFSCLHMVTVGWKVKCMAVVSSSLWLSTHDSILVYRIQVGDNAGLQLRLLKIFSSPRPTQAIYPSKHRYAPWKLSPSSPSTSSSTSSTPRSSSSLASSSSDTATSSTSNNSNKNDSSSHNTNNNNDKNKNIKKSRDKDKTTNKDKDKHKGKNKDENEVYRVWTGTDKYLRVFEYCSKTKSVRPLIKLIGGGAYPIHAITEVKDYILTSGSHHSTFAVWDAKKMRYIGELNRAKVWKGELKVMISSSPSGRRYIWAADTQNVQVWSCHFD
jgi:hypothetical protein